MTRPRPPKSSRRPTTCTTATTSPSRSSCRRRASFPDNWIYIHATDVKVGRIQNFGSWSPYLVKDGRTCLGLEYFVFEGDDIWNKPDDELIELGRRSSASSAWSTPADVEAGYVVRMPKAYPYYDADYKANVETIREWLDARRPTSTPSGATGCTSTTTRTTPCTPRMLTVENIFGADHDVWTVNVEEEYHEAGSTGRDAPVLPRREHSHADTAAAATLDPG